jgi:hypothetical protein
MANTFSHMYINWMLHGLVRFYDLIKDFMPAVKIFSIQRTYGSPDCSFH